MRERGLSGQTTYRGGGLGKTTYYVGAGVVRGKLTCTGCVLGHGARSLHHSGLLVKLCCTINVL